MSSAHFVPPGPHPGVHEPNALQQALWSLRRPIDSWPRAVFEELTYRPPAPGAPTHLMDPAMIREVFTSEAFTQGAMFRRIMRPVWGDGIVTSEGAAWRWQRGASAPAFRPSQMSLLAPFMSRAAQAAIDRWERGARIDLSQEAARISFDVILDTVLSGGEDL